MYVCVCVGMHTLFSLNLKFRLNFLLSPSRVLLLETGHLTMHSFFKWGMFMTIASFPTIVWRISITKQSSKQKIFILGLTENFKSITL